MIVILYQCQKYCRWHLYESVFFSISKAAKTGILKIVRFTCLTNNGIVPLLRILIYSDLSLWLSYCVNHPTALIYLWCCLKLIWQRKWIQTNGTSMIRRSWVYNSTHRAQCFKWAINNNSYEIIQMLKIHLSMIHEFYIMIHL